MTHTQGEPEEHPHWFPMFVGTNDFYTTEILATVPEEYAALSNGALQNPGRDGRPQLDRTRSKRQMTAVVRVIVLVFTEKATQKRRYAPDEMDPPAG